MSEVIAVGDKPTLLKAIELVLAEPAAIRKEALQLKDKYVTRYGSDRSEDEINAYAANKGLTWYVGTKARDFFSVTDSIV